MINAPKFSKANFSIPRNKECVLESVQRRAVVEFSTSCSLCAVSTSYACRVISFQETLCFTFSLSTKEHKWVRARKYC